MDGLTEALRAAFPGVADGPVRFLDQGFGSTVVLVGRDRVFRIARPPAAAAGHRREWRVLPRLEGRLPVGIPRPLWWVDRFAAMHRPLFQVMFEAGVDKARHPEVEQAALPLADSFLEAVRALSDGQEGIAEAMARAVGATAHGHASLLLDGSFGHGDDVVEIAAGRAATATMALVEGRRAFRSGDRAH